MKVFKSLAIIGLVSIGMISCGEKKGQDNTGSVAQENNNSNSNNDTSTSSNANDGQLRIAYVLMDSVASKYKRMEISRKKMEEEVKQMEKEYLQKQQALQQLAQKIQEEYQFMLKDDQKKAEQRLMRKQQEFRQYEQEMQMKLSQKESDFSIKNLKKIESVCEEYAKNNGYDFILTKTLGSQILFAENKYDVTNDIIDLLNEDYESTSAELTGE